MFDPFLHLFPFGLLLFTYSNHWSLFPATESFGSLEQLGRVQDGFQVLLEMPPPHMLCKRCGFGVHGAEGGIPMDSSFLSLA